MNDEKQALLFVTLSSVTEVDVIVVGVTHTYSRDLKLLLRNYMSTSNNDLIIY